MSRVGTELRSRQQRAMEAEGREAIERVAARRRHEEEERRRREQEQREWELELERRQAERALTEHEKDVYRGE
jgi:hypothetical protein